MADHVVGLVIRDTAFEAVEIPRRGALSFQAAAVHHFEPGLVERGEILEGHALAAELRTFWLTAGFTTKNVVIGIDNRSATIRRIELPALKHSELSDAIRYDIGELLSYPLEEALVDHTVLPQRADPVADQDAAINDIVAVAVRESTLESLRVLTTEARLKLVGTELIGTALLRSATASDQHTVGEGLGAYVRVSEDLTDLVVHDGDGILFARSLTIGVGLGSDSVASEIESQLAALDGFRAKEEAKDGSDTKVEAPGVGVAVESVARTLRFHQTDVDHRPITSVVVGGGQAGADGLLDGLSIALSLDAETCAVPDGWHDPELEPSKFDAAFGVALSDRKAELGRPPLRVVSRTQAIRRTDQAILAAAAALFLLAGLFAWTSLSTRRYELADTLDEADRVELRSGSMLTRLGELAEGQQIEHAYQSDLAALQTLGDDQIAMTIVIRQIAEAMPTDSALLSIDLRRSGLGEVPTGYSGPEPIALLTIAGVADDLDGVGRWLSAVQDLDGIGGAWLSQSAYGPYGADERIGAVFNVEAALTGAVASNYLQLDPDAAPPVIAFEDAAP